jgi:uncharacterized protein with GYD domain
VGKNLPVYILLSKLTSKGRQSICFNPDRIKEVNRDVEALGGKVLEQYSVLGPYDFVNIIEAPNNKVVNKLSILLCARGTIEIMSMPALPIEEFIAEMKNRTRKRLE